MDNVTHTLFALALARTGLDRRGPLVTPVLAVAASFPDADLVTRASGHLAYLRHHRGVTHALPGMALETLLVAGAAYAIGRLARVEKLRFAPLLLASALGLLSHLLLDALNTYGVRPSLPFDQARYFGDMAFIVDPWLWLAFGAGAYLGTTRGRRAELIWVALAVLMAQAAVFSDQSRAGVAVLVIAGIVAIAAIRRSGFAKERGRAFAIGALLVSGAYLGGLAAARELAFARGMAALRAELAPGEVAIRTSVSPHVAIPWRGLVILESEERIHFAETDLLGETAVRAVLAKHLDEPALRSLEGSEELATWRSFARHPFAAWSERGTLILGDARYDSRAEESWSNIEVASVTSR